MQSIFKRSFSSSKDTFDIKKVGMVGLGLMGHGIAQVAGTSGYEVIAVDSNEANVEGGMTRIQNSVQKLLEKSVEKKKLNRDQADRQYHEIINRIRPSTDLNELRDCDLVIEAIVEDINVKLPFYGKLGDITKSSCILASNTSSLPIREMADASGRSSHVVGLHFFNPVQLMKLVEVIRTDQTDPQVFESCKNWVQSLNKVAVSCSDTPGFIVNRLLVPNIAQALLMLERGVATKNDIDLSMKFGAGHPMGPIELADYVGLDTTLSILEGWVANFPEEPAFVVPDILREKVLKGHLGRKSGQGFYQWKSDKRID